MDKAQFYHNFWSRFGWTAWEESTVPDEKDENDGNDGGGVVIAELPYITYMVMEDDFEHPVYPGASLWDYGRSWVNISQKAKQIGDYIGYGGRIERIDNGLVWIQRGHPFAQRLSDQNDMVRRIAINIEVEFFTEN